MGRTYWWLCQTMPIFPRSLKSSPRKSGGRIRNEAPQQLHFIQVPILGMHQVVHWRPDPIVPHSMKGMIIVCIWTTSLFTMIIYPNRGLCWWSWLSMNLSVSIFLFSQWKGKILWIPLFLLDIQFYSPMPLSILLVQIILIRKIWLFAYIASEWAHIP